MGYKTISAQTIISIGENWLNKKNHTEHKYSVFFESRNKNTLFWFFGHLQIRVENIFKVSTKSFFCARLAQKLVDQLAKSCHKLGNLGEFVGERGTYAPLANPRENILLNFNDLIVFY